MMFPKLRNLHCGQCLLNGCSTLSMLKKHLSSRVACRSVLVSTCYNIFDNLALEDWLYKHSNIEERNVLLIWQNTPAVVIGRHQNPWAECHIGRAAAGNVRVARRNSGGGTVYHDRGNLNISFLTSRKQYDRKANLETIQKALCTRWGLNIDISSRDDLVLDKRYKVGVSNNCM